MPAATIARFATCYALDGWRAAHARLRRLRGPASAYPCAEHGCPRRGREWSLSEFDASTAWGTTPSGHRAPYSDDPANYSARCASHARLADRAQTAERRATAHLTVSPLPPRARVEPPNDAREEPEPPALFAADWTGEG